MPAQQQAVIVVRNYFDHPNPKYKKMRKLLFLLLLAIPFSQYSYSQATKSLDKDQTTDWQTLPDDYMKWYTYTYYNIHLSQDFIGLDLDSSTIDKKAFLNKLLTAKVFAFKIGTKADNDVYKLYPLISKDESIKATIKEMASTEIQHNKMEGTQISAFSFTDLNGIKYDSASTKGKLMVLKCWFIGCVACVKEFPELNKLVNNYKGNNNILFISLAIDKKEELTKFLKTKKFKYAVVPEMKDFMSNELDITQYPTHLLIDKTGNILKIVNRIDELVPFLEKASK
jgi:thiol-disulfide isomerase/thioredoxin